MGAGSLQIDNAHFITDNSANLNEHVEQISFFPYRNVFKKHTRFGSEFMEETNTIHPDSSSTSKFGSESTFIISRDGDLVNKMYLEIVLPNLTGGSSPLITGSSNARWVNSIAYALFDSIELQIHSSTIEKHTDLWLDLWNELTDEEFKEHTLVGKSSSIVGTTPDSTTYDNATKWYLPLHFFFTRKLSLSLPIFLLEDQQIKIKIKVKELSKLINYSSGTVVEAAQPTIKLYKQAIYLSKEEKNIIKNKFNKEGYEFLIDVLDSTTNIQDAEVTGTNFSITRNQYTFPIKELIWVFRHSNKLSTTSPAVPVSMSSTSGNDIFSYHAAAENSTLEGGIATRDPFTTVDIRIGSHNLFQETDRKADHFRTIQPYYHHKRVNTKYIYSFSFAENPHDFQPSGFFHLNAENNEKIDYHFKDIVATATDYRVSIYAYGYKILRYTKLNDISKTIRISLNHTGNTNLKNINTDIRDSFEQNEQNATLSENEPNTTDLYSNNNNLIPKTRGFKKGLKKRVIQGLKSSNELSANSFLPGFKYN